MTQASVIPVDQGPQITARQVNVNASAADIFALVADPHRHHELDGSGTVRDSTVKGPDRLKKGDKFSVGMKQFGVPYKITSTVTELADNKVVEWQHPMGHKWRWEMVETAPGNTQVTESFNYGTAKLPVMITAFGYDKKNGDGITKTLEQLAKRFA
ncbi:SRPBCC family protein [Williamsia maris]|uniref:Polyketide cyclase / dehydrase and lipid transport n=1 Tax=Williamsia maris TaxID=72806 RepID=A0ABT1HDD2_9NOCA|nr:SRPBCC family protein [Williamsia maris]MCP2176169.1 Polyketide cyclase / dehydrase and lipid transport [Williamsia maris]